MTLGTPEVPIDRDPTTTTTLNLHAPVDDPESADQADHSLEDLAPGTALLLVNRGPNAGSRFLLNDDVVTAGRHPASVVFLDDITVSRRHAEFRRAVDGSYSVHDSGSLNGTYVNRERVESVGLSNGDEVQLGKFRLRYLPATRRGDSDDPNTDDAVDPAGATQ